MGITPEENVAYFEKILQDLRPAGAATAAAMAKYIAQRTADVTLRRTSHAPGMWHHTPAGQPPARASGRLARGMFATPASGGLRGSARVGNSVDYSRILEFGCVIVPTNAKFLHWVDSGGSWYHKMLIMPPHPFLSRTTEDAILDGGLQQAAIDEFRKYDPLFGLGQSRAWASLARLFAIVTSSHFSMASSLQKEGKLALLAVRRPVLHPLQVNPRRHSSHECLI